MAKRKSKRAGKLPDMTPAEFHKVAGYSVSQALAILVESIVDLHYRVSSVAGTRPLNDKLGELSAALQEGRVR